MKRILVIAGRDQNHGSAIRKGMSLAATAEAKLEIIGFCHEDLEQIVNRSGAGKNRLKQEIMQHKVDTLEALVRELRESEKVYKKPDISIKVIWQKEIHEWIINRTKLKKYDMVIKAGRRSEKRFYTPTDWHLIRSCAAPVYLLTEKKWKKKGNILVALDIESSSRSKQKLNIQLLKTGRLMADIMNAELNCCFVINVPRILKELDAIDISTYRKKARMEYLPRVIDLIGPYGIPDNNIYQDAGEPCGRILKIANKLKADVVVIGSMGHKGISSKLIGNTAEQVLKHLYTDMIVVNHNVN